MTNDDGWSMVLHRAILLKPSIAVLSPKTQAALDKFRAKSMNAAAKPIVPDDIKEIQVRNICTKDRPMPQVYRASDNWRHPQAVRWDDGHNSDATRKCPYCGLIFDLP